MADIEVRTSGASVRASASDRIVIKLPENATTGYQWTLAEAGEPLEVESDDFVAPGQVVPGAAGQRVVVIRPRGSGRARVALDLKRAWEPEPIDHFEFNVDVVAD